MGDSIDHVAQGTGWWDIDPWLRPIDADVALAVRVARETFAERTDLWLIDE